MIITNCDSTNTLSVGLFVCTFSPCWKLWLNMVFKSGRKKNSSKEEKLLNGGIGKSISRSIRIKDTTVKSCKNSTLKIQTVWNGKFKLRSKKELNTICTYSREARIEKLVEKKFLVMLKLFAARVTRTDRKRKQKAG